jgi:hypothetical protein
MDENGQYNGIEGFDATQRNDFESASRRAEESRVNLFVPITPQQRSGGALFGSSSREEFDSKLAEFKDYRAQTMTDGQVLIDNGKFYTIDPRTGLKVEEPDVKAIFNSPNGSIVMFKKGADFNKFKQRTNLVDRDGNPVDLSRDNIISTADLKDKLTQKPNETWAEWGDRMRGYAVNGGKLFLFFGLVAGLIAGIVELGLFIRQMEQEASDVNDATYTVSTMQRKSLKYTTSISTNRICSGDVINRFANFDTVNKSTINNLSFTTSAGATGEVKDYEFTDIGLTETVKKLSTGPDLTFRVETTAMRRMSCYLAQVVQQVAAAAAQVVGAVASGVGSGLGIDWSIVILVIVFLIVGGVILTIALR